MSVKDYVNKVYIFGATIGVGYLASMVAKRNLKMNLGLPMTLEPALKMSVVLGACNVGVDYAIEKKWIPKEIIKGADGGSSKKELGCARKGIFIVTEKNKMSMLKFVNDGLGLDLTVFKRDDGSLLLKGKEVAEMLGYTNTKQAIAKNVSEKYRIRLRELQGGIWEIPPLIDLQGGTESVPPLDNQRPHTVSEEYRVRLGEIQKGTESVPFLGNQQPHTVPITKVFFQKNKDERTYNRIFRHRDV